MLKVQHLTRPRPICRFHRVCEPGGDLSRKKTGLTSINDELKIYPKLCARSPDKQQHLEVSFGGWNSIDIPVTPGSFLARSIHWLCPMRMCSPARVTTTWDLSACFPVLGLQTQADALWSATATADFHLLTFVPGCGDPRSIFCRAWAHLCTFTWDSWWILQTGVHRPKWLNWAGNEECL